MSRSAGILAQATFISTVIWSLMGCVVFLSHRVWFGGLGVLVEGESGTQCPHLDLCTVVSTTVSANM